MRSPRMAALLAAALVAAVLTGPARGEGDSALARAVELPAHEALIARRDRSGTVLRAFESDGCSGGLSEVWRLVADRFPGFARVHEATPPWEGCCVIHDRAYHDGARAPDPLSSFEARLDADRELEACVVETGRTRRDELARYYDITPQQVESAYATIGGAMFWAVRLGGAPCTGLPWRWGFGYPDCSVLGDTGN